MDSKIFFFPMNSMIIMWVKGERRKGVSGWWVRIVKMKLKMLFIYNEKNRITMVSYIADLMERQSIIFFVILKRK